LNTGLVLDLQEKYTLFIPPQLFYKIALLPILQCRFVLDLYYNQRKSVREIAKEARISFRDIGAILNNACEDKKAEQGQRQQDGVEVNQMQLSISTQAYKLFSDGKSPIEVAVALIIRLTN